MGTDIFYEMVDEPGKVMQLMQFYAEVCRNTSRMYIEAGVDVIAVVDPNYRTSTSGHMQVMENYHGRAFC